MTEAPFCFPNGTYSLFRILHEPEGGGTARSYETHAPNLLAVTFD